MRYMLIGCMNICTYVYLYIYIWTETILSHFHYLPIREQKGTKSFKHVLIIYVIKTHIHTLKESNALGSISEKEANRFLLLGH